MYRKLIACALLAGCAVGGAKMGAAQAQSELLIPDLTILREPLEEYRVDRLSGGRKLLRFSVAIFNQGDGPMEARGNRTSRRQPMAGTQAIYRRDGTMESRPIGQFIYHKLHDHWHVVDIADYRLLNALGSEVGATKKVSYCLRDDDKIDPTLPNASVYKRYKDCARGRTKLRLKTGISVGWADVYDTSVPGQWIDVTDVPPGEYTLEIIADPQSMLTEKDELNNTTRIQVTL